jgi:hypothetical protein
VRAALNTAFRLLVLALAAAPLAVPLSAAELEGVALEPRVRVDGEELQLNGAAVRTRVILKVYVAGLYLPARVLTAQEAIEAKAPKRIVLVMLRDATAQQFVDSIDAGLRANNSEGEIAAVKAQTEELMAMIRAVGEAKKGMRIVLDYVPREGTTLFVDGVAQGKPMAGRAFNQALLRIGLGEDPVQPDIMDALLGGPQ